MDLIGNLVDKMILDVVSLAGSRIRECKQSSGECALESPVQYDNNKADCCSCKITCVGRSLVPYSPQFSANWQRDASSGAFAAVLIILI